MKKLTTIVSVLAVLGMAQMASATPFSDAVNALNPVGYWEFEGDWTDSTAGGNTLTPFGTAAFTASSGLAGLGANSADFSHAGGQNGAYVATGAANALDLSGGTAYSINAWVNNAEDPGLWAMIATGRDTAWSAGTGSYYGLSQYRWTGGGGVTGMRTWTGGSLGTKDSIPGLGAGWHMLTATVDLSLVGSETTFYIDGVQVGVASTSGTTLGGPTDYFNVANNANTVTADWGPSDLNGQIDELAVFSTALSSGDVAALFAAANVPEPATLALTSIGVLLVACRRRR